MNQTSTGINLSINVLVNRRTQFIAGVDGNFIMMGSGSMIETQISAEGSTYSRNQLNELMDLAIKGIGELIIAQEKQVKP